MNVEICANSYESAIAAMSGGAHRIELCTDLSVGGLTPSRELIEKVIENIQIPVHVLIRPRDGDFCYTKEEIESMIEAIEFCKRTGCHGIVIGVLNSNRTIDFEHTKQLLLHSNGMNFTFHRAFDLVPDPIDSLEKLKKLDIDRLLSSGQEFRAIDGLPLLNKMKTASKGVFEIMPGGGILVDQVLDFKESGFNSIHLSAIKKREQRKEKESLFNISYEGVSDIVTIKGIVAQVN
jgi:Uncharacterized protein involved in copper resistance